MQKVQNKPNSLRTAGDDQRKFSRFDVRLSSFATPVPEDDSPDALWYRRRSKEKPAIVTDLSATGLHFISETNFPVGSQVWVSMQIDEKTYPVRGMVRRQNSHMRDGKTIYGHGIQFLRSDFAMEAVRVVMEYLEDVLKKKR